MCLVLGTDGQLPGISDYREDAYGLQVLMIQHNDLTGTLPPELADLRTLSTVLIHNNRLTGSLDNLFRRDSTSNSSSSYRLAVLDFSRNEFSGTLPGQIFTLSPLLTSLIGTDNCLTGRLPEEICIASSLSSVILNGLNSNGR